MKILILNEKETEFMQRLFTHLSKQDVLYCCFGDEPEPYEHFDWIRERLNEKN